MRSAAWSGRSGPLLASLLMVLGIAAGVATGAASGYAHPTSAAGGTASAAPSMHDDRHDWLRVSLVVRHLPAEAHSDTWWAVWPWADDAAPGRGRSHAGGSGGTWATATTAVPWSSRAPPVA